MLDQQPSLPICSFSATGPQSHIVYPLVVSPESLKTAKLLSVGFSYTKAHTQCYEQLVSVSCAAVLACCIVVRKKIIQWPKEIL